VRSNDEKQHIHLHITGTLDDDWDLGTDVAANAQRVRAALQGKGQHLDKTTRR